MLSNLAKELVTRVTELEAAVADRNRIIETQQQRWDSLVKSVHAAGSPHALQDRIQRLEGELNWYSKGNVPDNSSGWVSADPTAHAKRGREDDPSLITSPPRLAPRYGESTGPFAHQDSQQPPPPPNYPAMYSWPSAPSRTDPVMVEVIEHPKYKSKMCPRYTVGMTCPHGDRCSYAHGEAELHSKSPPQRRPPSPPRQRSPSSPQRREPRDTGALYKSKLCSNFLSGQVCPHGTHCTFAHGLADLNTRHHEGPPPRHADR